MTVKISEMIEFLKPKMRPANNPRQRQPNTGVGKMSLRRKLPHRVRQAIVIFAYGSDSDFSKIQIPPAKLAKYLNLSRKTVTSVLNSFKKYGKNLDTFQDMRHLKVSNFSTI